MTAPTQEATMAKDFAAVSELFGSSEFDDVHSLYREYRKSQPVMEGDILAAFGVPSQADYANTGRKVYTLFRHADILKVLRDSKTFTSEILNDGLGAFLGGFLLTAMGGERHKKLRALLAPAFTPTAVMGWKKGLTEVAREAVARIAPQGRAELMEDFLLPLPVRMIYQIIGFPNDPEQLELFAGLALRLLGGAQRDPEKAKLSMAAAFAASQELYDKTIAQVAQRRAAGSEGNDLIGFLLRAEYEGEKLTDAEVTELIRQFLPAAAETTTRSFGSMLVALLSRPELLARVRDDRTLVPKVIAEGMRWETASQFLARQATVDVEFHGVHIPAGAALSLASGSGNRDEAVFTNPDEFDIDREQRVNLGFGGGAHLCLGMLIAKSEMETMLNVLLDLPDLRLDPDAPPPKIVGAQLRGPRSISVVWN